jgi:hypothetical protein
MYLTFPPRNRREWSIKYWCAKEFGWFPDEVNNLPAHAVRNLVATHNEESKKIQRNINKGNGRRNILTGTNYG